MIRLSVTGVVLFGLAACLAGSHIGAFEATDGATVEKTPLRTFTTPRAALQAGLERFRSGDPASAIEALKYAASGGEALAQWKLAKIYASGDGVPRDDIKAYDYFSQIVTNYDEDDPNRRDLAIVYAGIPMVRLARYILSFDRRDPTRSHCGMTGGSRVLQNAEGLAVLFYEGFDFRQNCVLS